MLLHFENEVGWEKHMLLSKLEKTYYNCSIPVCFVSVSVVRSYGCIGTVATSGQTPHLPPHPPPHPPPDNHGNI